MPPRPTQRRPASGGQIWADAGRGSCGSPLITVSTFGAKLINSTRASQIHFQFSSRRVVVLLAGVLASMPEERSGQRRSAAAPSAQ
jgi:hypothetical protein